VSGSDEPPRQKVSAGDKFGGDKVMGDKVAGDKYENRGSGTLNAPGSDDPQRRKKSAGRITYGGTALAVLAAAVFIVLGVKDTVSEPVAIAGATAGSIIIAAAAAIADQRRS
jgi:hypothetical protein